MPLQVKLNVQLGAILTIFLAPIFSLLPLFQWTLPIVGMNNFSFENFKTPAPFFSLIANILVAAYITFKMHSFLVRSSVHNKVKRN